MCKIGSRSVMAWIMNMDELTRVSTPLVAR